MPAHPSPDLPHDFPRDWQTVRNAYLPSGAAKAQIRRNQLLPLQWRHLSPGDILEISTALWAEPPRNVSKIELEARLAIAMILTTGRNLGRLHPLKLFKNRGCMTQAGEREGIVLAKKNMSWHFIAGSHLRQKEVAQRAIKSSKRAVRSRVRAKRTATSDQKPKPKNVYRKAEHALTRPMLAHHGDRPIVINVAPVVQMCLQRCRIGVDGKVVALFKSPIKKLIPVIEAFLSGRRGPNVAKPRRSSTTLEGVSRYMMTEMTFHAGADIALAARLTDSTHYLSKSVIHYGVSKLVDIDKGMRRAAAPLRGVNSEEIQADLKPQWVGSVIAPTNNEVRELVEYVEKIRGSASSFEEKYRSIAVDTWALVSFATGHRGEGSYLPSSCAIDKSTGFCRLNDKLPDDRSKVRMVWIAPSARNQIAKYEHFLESLGDRIPDWLFRSLRQDVAEGRLPFIRFVNGIVGQCSLASIRCDFTSGNPQFGGLVANSGRHWLRSNLEGRCSTETLHAFFGHWHHGTEPWSYGSCLDPVIYREDLARTIPACLASVGWKAPWWPSKDE